MRTVTIGGILSSLLVATASAQAPSGTLDFSASDVRRMIELGENNPMGSIDAGQHVVFVWYEVRRPQPDGGSAPFGMHHSQLTEIYYIVEGSAMLRTGGRLTSERTVDISGDLPGTTDIPRFESPTFGGTIEGGVSRRVTAGDSIVMPPGTVHQWESVDPPQLSYIIFRIDPEHVLYPGYRHPELRVQP